MPTACALNNDLTDYVQCVAINVDLVINSGDSTGGVSGYSVASNIPSGYKLIAVLPFVTGSSAVYFYSARWSGNNIAVFIKRPAGNVTADTTYSGTVGLLCIRA